MKYVFASLAPIFFVRLFIEINKMMGTESNLSSFLFIYLLMPIYLLALGYHRVIKKGSSLVFSYILMMVIVVSSVFISVMFAEGTSFFNTLTFMAQSDSIANYVLKIEFIAFTLGWLLLSVIVLNKRNH